MIFPSVKFETQIATGPNQGEQHDENREQKTQSGQTQDCNLARIGEQDANA
jgi:hypothetical protein